MDSPSLASVDDTVSQIFRTNRFLGSPISNAGRKIESHHGIHLRRRNFIGTLIQLILFPAIVFAPTIVMLFRNRSQLNKVIGLNVALLLAPLFLPFAIPVFAIVWIYFVVWSVLPNHNLKLCFWITYFLCVGVSCVLASRTGRTQDYYALGLIAVMPLLIYLLANRLYAMANRPEAPTQTSSDPVSDIGGDQ